MRYLFLFLLAAFLLSGTQAEAQVSKEERIAELQQQIRELQAKLDQLLAERDQARGAFEERMELGSRGEDVRELQRFLNRSEDTRVAQRGPGSAGNETEVFGYATRNALIRFQEKYREDVLDPWGFSQGTGIAGPTTLGKLNELLAEEAGFSFSSLSPLQSETIVIRTEREGELTAEFAGRESDFFSVEGGQRAIMGVWVKQDPGVYPILIQDKERVVLRSFVHVRERSFPVTVLRTTPELEEKGFTPERIEENVRSEQETLRLAGIIGTYRKEARFSEPFTDPLDEMRNVGSYGNIRRQGEVSLQHLGVDLDARVGDPVYAVNEGLVRFVGTPANYGKTVAVDHGLGVYSVYLHLDEILVEEGEQVARGQEIAKAGNTGYSLAPHLHFSMRASGVSVDPLLFLESVNRYLK